MRFYQLALKYLSRKKAKTFLLFFVLVLVNTMILSTSMILRATNESMDSMQAKTNSKVVAEITDTENMITDAEVSQIENMKNIFTPFYSSHPYSQHWGIGLSLTYKIIHAHEGKIDIQSIPKEGTTVTLLLPLIQHTVKTKRKKDKKNGK